MRLLTHRLTMGFVIPGILALCQSFQGDYSIVQRGRYPRVVPVTDRISLHDDGTFTSLYQAGFRKFQSSGQWRSLDGGKKIELNSFISIIDSIPLVVSKLTGNGGDYVIIMSPIKEKSKGFVLSLTVDGQLVVPDRDTLVIEKRPLPPNLELIGYMPVQDGIEIMPYPVNSSFSCIPFTLNSPGYYVLDFPLDTGQSIMYYRPMQGIVSVNGRYLVADHSLWTGFDNTRPRRYRRK